MLDVTSRDQAARQATWETPQGEIDLPAVLHAHTTTHPAPEHARICIGQTPHETLPTLTYSGSAFSTTDPEPSRFSLPKSLIYPGSVDTDLQRAADEENPDGFVRLAHDPETLTPHEGLVVTPTSRAIEDDAWKLASFLVTARQNAGPNAVLYTPGIGRPDQIALAAMAGVDLFDGLTPILEGLKGHYLTPEGQLLASELDEPPCACPACQRDPHGPLGREPLIEHNRHAVTTETRRVRHAIQQGALRELFEARCRAKPEHVATYRRYDADHAPFFETRVPAVRERELPVLSERTLGRPEIQRWLQRLGARYAPPESANVLVVLPCSATKPYQNSPTHRRIRPAIEDPGHGRAHVVSLTSPLGAVPEELELAYPAAHYDVPVTGDWTNQEATIIQQAFQRVWKSGTYDQAILHVPPEEANLLEGVLPGAERTVDHGERATDDAALDRLRSAVQEATRGLDATARTDLFMEHMENRIDWQFGPGTGDVLAQDTEIRGRYPYLKLMHGDTQLLMLKPERGALTLTLEGGQRLFEATDAFNIHIDDFHPKGTVFAPGVLDAHDAIRPEDEVLIHHEGDLRAVGRASAPGPLMAEMTAGACAEVRHHA